MDAIFNAVKEYANGITVVSLLLTYVIYSTRAWIKGDIVPGWAYRDKCKQCDRFEELALRAVGVANEASHEAVQVVRKAKGGG